MDRRHPATPQRALPQRRRTAVNRRCRNRQTGFMHTLIEQHRGEIADLCRRYSVRQLAVFGSAARGTDFDPATSDADFLVTFTAEASHDLARFADFKDALEALLGRPVDLVDRGAVEESRNYIRRRRILGEAEPVYG